ncbi:diuretic hormone receptor isoform X1 [Bombyx mori]|uniref:G-protein coupled receptors family 2 profile 2 domain-containing protein n=1 Tax=Bombyx mori TaxID=7091 RepID=A0A8R2HUH9_BOMMO|nr:diuretic hormone receptor isoform X1 [Bombyx mori]
MTTYILSACSWILNLALQNWSDEAQQDQTSCMILVICMHYFYLTNFFWMLVEGLYLYMLVVETFTAENIKLKVYTTIGWGAPAIFITIWVVSRCFVNVMPSTGPDGLALAGEAKMCIWMHEHQVDWIHKAPALAGLALNLFFLVRIMWVLITKLRSANTLETEQYRKATKALLVLIPLLGITNLLVLCGPSDDSWFAYSFDYARALMLSTQGFTVALFYCFMNTEVRHAIRYHVERWKTGRNIGGGRRRGASYSKDWSPRSRTESIRTTSRAVALAGNSLRFEAGGGGGSSAFAPCPRKTPTLKRPPQPLPPLRLLYARLSTDRTPTQPTLQLNGPMKTGCRMSKIPTSNSNRQMSKAMIDL